MATGVIVARAITDMLNRLADFIPPAALPDAEVSIVGITERSVGLGNRCGTDTSGTFTTVAMKGGRLDTVVRFRLWASQPTDVDLNANALHSNLLQNLDTLWSEGFLKLEGKSVAPTDYMPQLDSWLQNVDYHVLYEFRYEDSDGAESLIARIPVDSDLEERDSPDRESFEVTDHMVRWDSFGAPALIIRADGDRPQQLLELNALFFLPSSWNGGEVLLSATVGGVTVSRTISNARLFFETVLIPQPGTTELGGDSYRFSRLEFPNPIFPEPIILTGNAVFQVRYAAVAFDSPAVAYLHALK